MTDDDRERSLFETKVWNTQCLALDLLTHEERTELFTQYGPGISTRVDGENVVFQWGHRVIAEVPAELFDDSVSALDFLELADYVIPADSMPDTIDEMFGEDGAQ